MTKEDYISSFIYLVMAGIILAVGLLVFRPAMSSGYIAQTAGQNFAFLLVALLIGVLINVAFIEVGHLIGGLIGGYEILSFNMLGLCFYKVLVKNAAKPQLKFKFKSFNGLSGETIIKPKKEKSNPMFYVFTPLLLILLEFVALYCVVVFIKTPERANTGDPLQFIKYGVIVVATIGGCFAFYNYFPAKLDSLNDGYRIVALNKKINVVAYNEKLLLEANDYYGIKNEKVTVFDEIADFTAQVNLLAAKREFVNGNVDKTLEILDKNIENKAKMSKSTLLENEIEKAYVLFMTKDIEEATNYYKSLDETTRNYILGCKDLPSIRTYILYIGLVEKSASEIKFALNKKKKALERVTDGVGKAESDAIDRALERVYSVYPELKETKKENK